MIKLGVKVVSQCQNIREDESDIPGVSAMLHVSVHPLDVCYAGIRIIEKDEGYEGPAGSLAGPQRSR